MQTRDARGVSRHSPVALGLARIELFGLFSRKERQERVRASKRKREGEAEWRKILPLQNIWLTRELCDPRIFARLNSARIHARARAREEIADSREFLRLPRSMMRAIVPRKGRLWEKRGAIRQG